MIAKSSKWKKITIMLLSALLFVPLVIPQASANEDVIVKNVEAREKPILKVDGKEFKDLNANVEN